MEANRARAQPLQSQTNIRVEKFQHHVIRYSNHPAAADQQI